MQQLVAIGKPTPAPSIREMIERMAQREGDEIRRLKEAAIQRLEH